MGHQEGMVNSTAGANAVRVKGAGNPKNETAQSAASTSVLTSMQGILNILKEHHGEETELSPKLKSQLGALSINDITIQKLENFIRGLFKGSAIPPHFEHCLEGFKKSQGSSVTEHDRKAFKDLDNPRNMLAMKKALEKSLGREKGALVLEHLSNLDTVKFGKAVLNEPSMHIVIPTHYQALPDPDNESYLYDQMANAGFDVSTIYAANSMKNLSQVMGLMVKEHNESAKLSIVQSQQIAEQATAAASANSDNASSVSKNMQLDICLTIGLAAAAGIAAGCLASSSASADTALADAEEENAAIAKNGVTGAKGGVSSSSGNAQSNAQSANAQKNDLAPLRKAAKKKKSASDMFNMTLGGALAGIGSKYIDQDNQQLSLANQAKQKEYEANQTKFQMTQKTADDVSQTSDSSRQQFIQAMGALASILQNRAVARG